MKVNNIVRILECGFVPRFGLKALLLLFFYGVSVTGVHAASLQVAPATGVYTANSTFTVTVQVGTGGQSVNAAEGTLSFNPKELSVVSASRGSSIFNLWVTEPTFSNSAGTISFSGGLPSGYTGAVGSVMSVTFRALGSGPAKLTFKNGSVLANDGKGTNILTSMSGGTYTIQAPSTTPAPEMVVEYVPPANTPGLPQIKSTTHPDENAWYSTNEAKLSWSLPAGIVAVRTLLDDNRYSVPTKVYENPIKDIALSDLPEGISYFHLQFKNSDGWGKVAHYRLAIDTKSPEKVEVTQVADADLSNPVQTLQVKVSGEESKIKRYIVRVDTMEAYEYLDQTGSGTIKLSALEPGYHTVSIEAFDSAGNSNIGNYSFTIASFDKPSFTEYPSEINQEVIPVIKGLTRPRAKVEVSLQKIGTEKSLYSVQASDSGEFVFIPDSTFMIGVYEIVARAIDEHGAQSDYSDPIRIAVQQPGYMQIGSLIVSVLSVLVSLLALVFIMIIGALYLVRRARHFRGYVRREAIEAIAVVGREFATLKQVMDTQESIMRDTRKTKKLTKGEEEMIEAVRKTLTDSQQKIEKEVRDIISKR